MGGEHVRIHQPTRDEERRMSEYGCCTLSRCVYTGNPIPESCDECPHYDPNFFKEENDADTSDQGER